ncbi:ABC transporter ATP-binding protein [Acinetobacter larvae]|uniref:ABC transporter ATP-binding protein n=1 Tax=Acinetobacter larvae TaxID=1789224 RepID=A0A1B2LYT5_9GAMM|nr:ABC transporter ATP-binding protein [Acinetobacter larvae]AOA58100.1 ABC transporter ATP-binding protein [Acinetobacter larvae]
MHGGDKTTVTQHVSPIRQVLAPIYRPLMLATLLAAVGAMLTLLPMLGIAYLLEHLLLRGSHAILHANIDYSIATITTISVLSLLLGMLLMTAGEMVAHIADNRMTQGLRLKLAEHLSQLPLGWFRQHSSGEVKQILQDDIAMLHSLTAHFYPAVGRAVGSIVMAVLCMLWIDWRMTIVVLLPFLAFVWFLAYAMRASQDKFQDFATKMAAIQTTTVEFSQAIPVLKTFAQSGQASRRYRQAVDAFALAFQEFTRPLVAAMAHAHAMIAPVTILAVVVIAIAVFVEMGWGSVLQLYPFAIIAPAICAPVLLLHTLLHDLQSSTAAAQRVLALFDVEILSYPIPDQAAQIQDHSVRFENVSFAYHDEQVLLHNLNFHLAANQVTAIVGASGAGKSTIAQLLLRFFDVTAGRISLGGVDIRALSPASLYQHIGFVLQDVQLIHASVRDNIALGRLSATAAEVEAVARAAHIHERIMAEEKGYDAIVGVDVKFSGGEQQRISLARAMLLDPPILVLDEATAAVDAASEVAIQQALSQFAQNRTVLIIAHRLQSIMHAAQILVMDDGKIIEQGRHQQLLQQNGRYAALWRLAAQPQAAPALVVTTADDLLSATSTNTSTGARSC